MSRKPPKRPSVGMRSRRMPPIRVPPAPPTSPPQAEENDNAKSSHASTVRGSIGGSGGHPRNANQGPGSTYRLQKASDLVCKAEGRHAGSVLRMRWVGDGESVEIRFVTDDVVTLPVHTFVPDGHGGKMNVQCLGDPCSLCLSGDRPEDSCLLLTYFLEDRDLGVFRFKSSSHPGSLAAQLLPLLGQKGYLNYIVEILKRGKAHSANIITIIDPNDPNQFEMDFGDDVLADLVEHGGPSPDELVALIERRSNKQLIIDLPWLKDKLRRRGFDPSRL